MHPTTQAILESTTIQEKDEPQVTAQAIIESTTIPQHTVPVRQDCESRHGAVRVEGRENWSSATTSEIRHSNGTQAIESLDDQGRCC